MKLTMKMILPCIAILWVVLPASAQEIATTPRRPSQDQSAWFSHESGRFEMAANGQYFAIMTQSQLQVFKIEDDLSAATLVLDVLFENQIHSKYRIFRQWQMTISPDGQWVAVAIPDEGDAAYTLSVWDTQSGEITSELKQDFYDITGLFFSPTMPELVITHQYGLDYWMGQITVLNVETQEIVNTYQARGSVGNPQISPDGERIFYESGNGTSWQGEIYYIRTGGVWGHMYASCRCSISPNWQHMIAFGPPDSDHPYFLDIENGEMFQLAKLQNQGRSDNPYAWSDDGRYLAMIDGNNIVNVMDIETLQPHAIGTSVSSVSVQFLEFLPHQHVLVFNTPDNEVAVWKLDTTTQLSTLAGGSGEISDMQVSPDGRLLSLRRDGFALQVWNLQTGRLLQVFKSWWGEFSPDGRFYIIFSGNIQFWHLPED